MTIFHPPNTEVTTNPMRDPTEPGSGVCEMPHCDREDGLKLCSDPEDNRLVLCPGCRDDWPVDVVTGDVGSTTDTTAADAADVEWPSCIQCDSDETTVVPLTGEWTCHDCGCQWTYDELPIENETAEQIPVQIEKMIHALGANTDQNRGDT